MCVEKRGVCVVVSFSYLFGDLGDRVSAKGKGRRPGRMNRAALKGWVGQL